MRISFAFRDATGTVESMQTVIDGLTDMSPFFADLREPWYESRRALYETQGDSADATWPRYEDTAEIERYVFVKGSILSLDGPVGSEDILMWGGPARLHAAVTGESSEAIYESDERSARIVVDVEYASNHDKGEGDAPEWAWPGGDRVYTTPQRRLSAMGGGDRGGSFQLLFSASLGQYAAEMGGGLGLKSEDLRAEMMRVYAPLEGV